MNNQQLEKKIDRDIADIRHDLTTLKENSVSTVTKGFEKIKSDTKETLSGTTESSKKGVEYGLDQYTAKAREYMSKVPGDIVDKVTRYPWVAITVGLGIGLLLGGLFKPSLRS